MNNKLFKFYVYNGTSFIQTNFCNWIAFWERFYFLGTNHGIPGFSGKPKNRTSFIAEGAIENLLLRGLKTRADLILALAWKIGAIDMSRTEADQAVRYKNNFDVNGTFLEQYAKTTDCNTFLDNFTPLLKSHSFDPCSPKVLLDIVSNNVGQGTNLGYVKQLAIVYFLSRGIQPIYDKYAAIALDAILNDIVPGMNIHYKYSETVKNYDEFKNKLVRAFGSFIIPRNVDRALWVYGHFFKIIESGKGTKRSSGSASIIPVPKGPDKIIKPRDGVREMVNSSNFKSYLLRNGRKLNTAYPNDVKAVSRTFYNDPDHIYNNYNTIDLNEILNRIIREPERRIELAAGGQGGEIKPYQSAIRAFMEYVNNIKQNNK